MRRLLLLLALAVALAPAPAPAQAGSSAQPGSCDIHENRKVERRMEGMIPMIYVEGPFRITCRGGEELRALSGTVNEWTREIVLVGDVFFQDPEQTLTADHATYSSSIGRLYATGNVVFTNRSEGSTIRGPELEYLRAIVGRPVAQVNAGQRPHLTLQPKEAGPDAEPLEIDADRVTIDGQNSLQAYGAVVIRRSDLDATAGEARYDRTTERLDLRREARIESERFDLAGEEILARLSDGALEHVHARTAASLTGEELTVTAPDLQLFFAEELLQRAVARVGEAEGEERAVATSRTFRLEADSIDALVPGQSLEQVIAIGSARGEALDTTRAEPPADTLAAAPDSVPAADSAAVAPTALIDRDWIVGDTVIGYFARADSAAPSAPESATADTAVVLERLVARGAAQSLYRMEPDRPRADGRKGVNYLSGEVIELVFEAGELQVAEVTGLRKGLYLDPSPPAQTPASQPEATPRTERAGRRGRS